MFDRFNLWVAALVDRAQALRDDHGQAMVEYAIILGLVSVVAIGVLTTVGTDVQGVLNAVEGALSAVPGA